MPRQAIWTFATARAILLVAALSAFPGVTDVRSEDRSKENANPPNWPELATSARTDFADAAFREPSPSGLSEAEIARWLESLPGKGSRIRSERTNDLSVAGFEGLARLRAPWPPDAVLRMAPFDHDGLGMHFWSGLSGVSFYYYEHPRPMWAGYRTTRREKELVPATHVLLGTDNDRYQRTMRGTIEIRHQRGTLILSRGDLRLLTIPMADAPSEVIFERRALFQSFTMYRGAPIPEEPTPQGRDLLDEKSPSKLRWAGDVSMGAKLVRDKTGSVRLERPSDAGTVFTGIRLPATGLYEVRIQLEAADPGTGIYLADDTGRPKAVIGLQRHSPSGAPVLAFLRPDTPQLECEGEPRSQRVAFSGEGQWLRIIAGLGTVKCQVSGDGRHWGRALDPARGIAGPFSQVGLIAFRNPAEGRISIKRLQVHELSDVCSVADKTLLERVPAEILERPSRLGDWIDVVLNSQPPGVNLRDWRMACSVAKLSRGMPGMLGNTILEGLLDDCLDSAMPTERLLQVLEQSALVYDGWNAPECHRFTQFYERLGLTELQRGHPAPWSLVGRALLANPLTTSAQYQTMPEALVRSELASLTTAGRWREAKDLCRILNFWNRPARPGRSWPEHRQRLRDLVEWTQSVAASELGEIAADGSQEQATFCPVTVPPNRSGLSLMTDLDAALKGGQFEDACRLLLGTHEDSSTDLLPAIDDPNRLIRLPLAIAAGMNEHPEWRNVMRARYEKLAGARIQLACDAAQADELRLLAIQFAGLPAATTARMWLGDRALIEGNFLGALDEFEEGLLTTPPERRDELITRIELARACLGIDRPSGQEGTRKTSVPTNALPGLEKTLRELRSRPRNSSNPAASNDRNQQAFASSAWDVVPTGEIQLDPGKAPGTPELARLDWPGQQLAHVQTGDLLYVSNRRQIVCFNLKTNRQLWRVAFPDPDATLALWPMVAFQPVVTANRVYVRSSEKDWLGLSCLDAISGKLRWRTERGMIVLSDPLLLQGNLYFFSVSSPPLDRIWRLDLNTVDPESGAIIARNQVLEMQRTEGRAYSCQAALAGNRLIGTIAGAIFCCDLTGRPVWLRREPWPSVPADPDAPQESFANPVVIGERTLILQAGALDLVCLENRTGKIVWRRPLADARRLMGIDEHRAYVQTGQGLAAVSLADGTIAWWKSGSGLLEAHWIRSGQPLLVVQREELANQISWPLLTWVDAESGRDLAVWPLAALKARNPQLSHLVPREDGFLAFFGEGDPPSRRTLLKLIPHTNPALPTHDDDGVDRWTVGVSDPATRRMAERFLPEWSFIGGAPDSGNGLREEYSGQKEVLATLSTSERAVRFTRKLGRRSNGSAGPRRTRLIIQAAHDPSKRWQLRVRAGGRELLSTIVEAASSTNSWGTWEVDLSEFDETGAQVSIDQIPLDQSARGYWKRIELVR